MVRWTRCSLIYSIVRNVENGCVKSKSKCQLRTCVPLPGFVTTGTGRRRATHRIRSGMFKHPNVVPITAEKLDSKQQSKEETIPPSRTGMVLQIAIRQMLAADHRH